MLTPRTSSTPARTGRPSRAVVAVVAAGAFAACLLTAPQARAQFANHSIGFEAAGVYVANPEAQRVGSGAQLGLNAALYIESGFELYFRALVGIHHGDAAICGGKVGGCEVVGVVPAMGFRYLFSEDTIRPYLGLTAGYLAFFGKNADNSDAVNSRFSLSPMGGIEFFVAENFSIGLQAEYHLMLELNGSPAHAVIGLGKVGWYF